MDYCDFIFNVKKHVEEKMEGRNSDVEIMQIIKTNDCVKDGLIIREKNQQAAPTIYLDDLYSWYLDGMEIEEIVDKVFEISRNSVRLMPSEFLEMNQYEKAREHIICRLVNRHINEKYLEDVPHVDFLDLSMTFHCSCFIGGEQNFYCSKINNEIMKEWNISTDVLYETAMKNTPKLMGIYLEDIKNVLKEMMSLKASEYDSCILEVLEKKDPMPMYILTNQYKNSGAVCMFFNDILKKISNEFNSDLFIVPSSVHEVLVVPSICGMKREDVDEMVRSVNQEILKPQDILSDHAYEYIRSEDRIIM